MFTALLNITVLLLMLNTAEASNPPLLLCDYTSPSVYNILDTGCPFSDDSHDQYVANWYVAESNYRHPIYRFIRASEDCTPDEPGLIVKSGYTIKKTLKHVDEYQAKDAFEALNSTGRSSTCQIPRSCYSIVSEFPRVCDYMDIGFTWFLPTTTQMETSWGSLSRCDYLEGECEFRDEWFLWKPKKEHEIGWTDQGLANISLSSIKGSHLIRAIDKDFGREFLVAESGDSVYYSTDGAVKIVILRKNKVTRAVKTDELNARLRFLGSKSETLRGNLDWLCTAWTKLDLGTAISSVNARKLAKTIEGRTAVDGKIIGSFLLIYPCLEITQWSPAPHSTDCFAFPRIEFRRSRSSVDQVGFIDPQTSVIIDSSPAFECGLAQSHYVIGHDGHSIVHVDEKGRVSSITVSGSVIIPSVHVDSPNYLTSYLWSSAEAKPASSPVRNWMESISNGVKMTVTGSSTSSWKDVAETLKNNPLRNILRIPDGVSLWIGVPIAIAQNLADLAGLTVIGMMTRSILSFVRGRAEPQVAA